jgi:hypothetical protein
MHSVRLSILLRRGNRHLLIEGVLRKDIVVGGEIELDVTVRHGDITMGHFTSSPILRVDGHLVLTESIIYQILRTPPLRTLGLLT